MDHRMTITGTKPMRHRKLHPFTHINSSWDDVERFYEDEEIPMVTAELPVQELTAMADALCEMKDLMRDPETARLLMEARFINRLKGNR
jgi:hypothetical protein